MTTALLSTGQLLKASSGTDGAPGAVETTAVAEAEEGTELLRPALEHAPDGESFRNTGGR